MDKKIILAIEKLAFVFRHLLWDIGRKKRLTPIQIQILVYLARHSRKFCRASYISKEFGVSKATVSDAVRSLVKKKFVSKKVLNEDKRVHILELSSSGRNVSKKLSNWAKDVQKCISRFSPETKTKVMVFLMELIASLQRAGIITISRMCILCENFQMNVYPKSSKPHYCRLTNTQIGVEDLKIDCEKMVYKFG